MEATNISNMPSFKDGEGDDENPFEICGFVIKPVRNGWILFVDYGEEETQLVFKTLDEVTDAIKKEVANPYYWMPDE